MKKIIIFALCIITCISINAQVYEFYQTRNYHNQLRLNTMTGELIQVQDDGQKFIVHNASTPGGKIKKRYILKETKNMWNFILLDRAFGKLWQCQFSVDGIENIMSIPINESKLSENMKLKFSIHPMTSMYQFYLTNDDSGEMWQFQWTTQGDEYRWIQKVE